MNAAASEVFGVSQYKDATLMQLHADLQRNRGSKIEGTWENERLAAVREEMQRRGIRAERSGKP